MKLKKFKIEDYQYLGLWENDLFSSHIWTRWWNKERIEALGFFSPFAGLVYLKGGHCFVHKEVMKQISLQIQELIDRERYDVFEKMKVTAEMDLKKLLRKAIALAKKEPTEKNFIKFKNIAEGMVTYWSFANLMSEAAEPILIEKANLYGISIKSIPELMPRVHSFVLDQKLDLQNIYLNLKSKKLLVYLGKDNKKLINLIQKDKLLRRALQKHLKKYGWLELMNYIGNPLTIERLIEQLSLINDQKLRKKCQPEKKIKIFMKFTKLLKAISAISFLRQAGSEYSSMLYFELYNFLNKTAKKLNIRYEEMLSLTTDEIARGLESKNNGHIKKLIQKRKGYNWLAYADDKTNESIVIDDKKTITQLFNLMVPKNKERGNLSGQVGNKGKAIGISKIVMTVRDFQKFNNGDILVTTMTTPDFVILMQKSSAIITDIGGLLCHAAIISRELNKPCVIGTKFATQVLKDGDMVEVDADKGMVKIIK